MQKEYTHSPATISKEEEEKLINRVYTQHMALKVNCMEELDRRFYPMAPPMTISQEKLQASIRRQVDDEMEKRRMKREAEAVARAAGAGSSGGSGGQHRAGPGRPLPPEEVESSVGRMYSETIEKNKMKREQLLQEQIKREQRGCLETKKIRKGELLESVNRLSVPKKTVFTIAEINRIYGL